MTLLPALLSAAVPQSQPNAGAGMTAFLFQMTVILALGYFLFIRPQQKQRKAHEDRIKQLKRGDEIVTAGGIVGEVVHIAQGSKDGAPTPTLDDRITVKTGESRVVVERGRIARVMSPAAAEDEKAK